MGHVIFESFVVECCSKCWVSDHLSQGLGVAPEGTIQLKDIPSGCHVRDLLLSWGLTLRIWSEKDVGLQLHQPCSLPVLCCGSQALQLAIARTQEAK